MMPHHPPKVGKPATQEAYRKLFNDLDHHVEVKVDEIILAGFKLAFARTTTTGTCTVRATGKDVPDAVRQLWVLKVPDPETGGIKWRIARYSFSPTSPSS
jgi:ketosteroid isomerase-like protein